MDFRDWGFESHVDNETIQWDIGKDWQSRNLRMIEHATPGIR